MIATEVLHTASEHLKQDKNMYSSAKEEAFQTEANWKIKVTFP